ncbi:MAG: DUF454 family protein [Pseudomonadota bacterium]
MNAPTLGTPSHPHRIRSRDRSGYRADYRSRSATRREAGIRPLNWLARGALLLAGAVLTVMGLLGLLLPFAPGLLFLLLAGLCFAAASPGIRRQLERHPRLAPHFGRWQRGAGLDWPDRARLLGLLLARALSDLFRRR